MTTLEKDKKYLIQCYTTDDIVFTKGKGMYMYDEDGKSTWIFRPVLRMHPWTWK